MPLHVSSTVVLIIRRSNCIIQHLVSSHPVVGRPVHILYVGRGVDHPPLPGAEDKERVELYLYSPFEPSWPVLG